MNFYGGPEVSTPTLGAPLSEDLTVAYRTTKSAYRQAEAWNNAFKEDPYVGPEVTGLMVGVSPVKTFESRYPLVWVHARTEE